MARLALSDAAADWNRAMAGTTGGSGGVPDDIPADLYPPDRDDANAWNYGPTSYGASQRLRQGASVTYGGRLCSTWAAVHRGMDLPAVAAVSSAIREDIAAATLRELPDVAARLESATSELAWVDVLGDVWGDLGRRREGRIWIERVLALGGADTDAQSGRHLGQINREAVMHGKRGVGGRPLAGKAAAGGHLPLAGLLAVALIGLWGCAREVPQPYPPDVEARFAATCPLTDPRCACTYAEVRRAMDAAAFSAALDRFEARGLMEPKLVQAREACRERR
jgi:hypothetical protein